MSTKLWIKFLDELIVSFELEVVIMVKHKWKYYIVLNNVANDLVEDTQTSDGLPLCSDYAVAKWFDSPEELNEWVKNNTTLSLEDDEYHIEGHYETIKYED